MSNLLISPQEVASMAFSSREKITPAFIRSTRIDVAQEQFIRPRFGQAMFDAIKDGKYAEFNSIYIKPALAQFVRCALIEELSVQITDQGTLIYSSSKNEDRQTNAKTVTENSNGKNDADTRGSTDKTTTQNGSSNDVERTEDSSLVERISQTEFSFIDNKKSTIMGEKSNESSDTIVDSSTDTSRRVTVMEKATTKNDDTVAQKNDLGETMRPATQMELRALTIRAILDGNVLLAKAVRFVESHADDFPSYVASRVSNRIFV